ncbi:hypothetical protein CL659_02615 [bacterium]|nr:hypothetical protein [bacterium]|tara:strand:+ start:39210 stop:40106 length:897 start_codon:yes stop_codon:yes gene_type:complete
MKETDVIKLIKKAFPLTGDDSYWEKDGIAMSVDSSIQGRHFLLDRENWIEEGIWNSVAGAITDVAAVGSNPKLIMASFCFPSRTDESVIKKAVKALSDVSKYFNLSVVGGDLSQTSSDIVFSISVIGFNAVGPGLSSAKKGDLIGVTGWIGSRPLGWYLAINKIEGYRDFVKQALKPCPNIKFPIMAARYASAMTDITDGIGFDLANICRKSNLKPNIFSEIPYSDSMKNIFSELNLDPEMFYKQGGDYEFLLTFEEKNKKKVKDIAKSLDLPFSIIGKMEKGNVPDWYGKGSEIVWR